MDAEIQVPQEFDFPLTIRQLLKKVRDGSLLWDDRIGGKNVGEMLVQYERKKYSARKSSLDTKKEAADFVADCIEEIALQQ